MTGFTAPSGGADAKYISATSTQNTVSVEVGKKYLISVAICSGYYLTADSLSNCVVISSSTWVNTSDTGYRRTYLKTYYIKATGTTLTFSCTFSAGTTAEHSTIQAITCYEI